MGTHRFDHKVDRRFKTEASRGARVEVITGRRRDWTDEEKLAIVAESCEDGVVISDVARRRTEFNHFGCESQSFLLRILSIKADSRSELVWLRETHVAASQTTFSSKPDND